MASKRLRLPKTFADLLLTVPANVASLSYDPQTGSFAATFWPSQQEEQEQHSAAAQEEAPPEDMRFALERFNHMPARGGKQ